jgi:hypothetical protein
MPRLEDHFKAALLNNHFASLSGTPMTNVSLVFCFVGKIGSSLPVINQILRAQDVPIGVKK